MKAILLGIIQGLSEFLPISSSGHLVLAEEILHFKEGGLAFEVFVHFGTLLAVFWVFRKDFIRMITALPFIFHLRKGKLDTERRDYAWLAIFIFVGSIPAAVIGILWEDTIEQLFESHVLVLFMLFVTGLIMLSSRFVKERKENMNVKEAFLIGIAQAFAIIPGISRSGSTILLSSPVIIGATLLKLKHLLENPPASSEIIHLSAATIAATISGYFAIVWLLEVIKQKKLQWFGLYCIGVSIIGLIVVNV